MHLTLFPTCLVENFSPRTVQAVRGILEKHGHTVGVPRGLTCCGQPAFNAGHWEEARQMARHTLRVLEAAEGPVIVPSGSCAAMIRRHYPQLFAEEPSMLARAQSLAARTFEFSEFLWEQHPAAPAPQPEHGQPALAYHPSCHLLRSLGIETQPQNLLRAAGVPFTSLEAECCGFGGLFAIDQPELSGALLARKLEAIEASGAQIVTGCDLSCLIHIEGGLRKRGSPVRCMHIAEVLGWGRSVPSPTPNPSP
ncbi:MAG: (Fe-S)-binding protein [Anaerolineales bacterium]